VPDALDRLDGWLSAQRPDFYAALRPGLSAEALSDLSDTFGMPISAPLRSLWRWRDGQAGLGAGTFFFNRTLMSAGESAAASRMLREMFARSPTWWGPQWVPIITNGAGDYICVDQQGGQRLGRGQTSRRGQIIEHWHDSSDRAILAPDLWSWLAAMLDSFAEGPWQTRDGAFDLPLGEAAWKEHRARLREQLPGYPIRFSGSRR